MRDIINNKRPVIRSDGSPVRDYIFIDDIVRGYLTLAEHMDDRGIHGQAFNFGAGQPVSVLELIKLILKVADRDDLQPDIQNTAHGEILRQYLSAERAHATLGWKPAASIEERLAETYQWYSSVIQG
jgi:CDP-glucose 4,6-dehydratase